jgi:hypothetical protein
MTKKSTSSKQTYILPTIKSPLSLVVVALITIVLSGFVGYRLAYQKYNPNITPTQNTPGYIAADAARNQVNNFYQQYLHPKKETPEESRNVYVSHYGDKNLVFYKAYYQHGFDPIVCSSVVPTSVTATSVQPGAGAVVDAEAKYPDGSTANIVLTLVLNAEGFRIDSITCPGDKGNLPPIL